MNPPSLLEVSSDNVIPPLAEPPPPFGDTPFLEQVEGYAELARVKKHRGAGELILAAMPALHEARAALLGARTAGLPVHAAIRVQCGDKSLDGAEALAALLCLQELGAASFGLEFPSVTGEITALYATLTPYAKIPLSARLTAPASADPFGALLRAGADVLICAAGDDMRTEAAKAVSGAHPVPRPPREEDAPLLLCDASGVYYLEEDFTLSDELSCAYDMSEEILEQEYLAFDALCFHVVTVDDALNLGRNAHMARQAVCILAESADALEMALLLYSGRALVDARSDVDEDTMLALAKAYGAIIR